MIQKYVRFGLICGLVVILDQITKLLVVAYIPKYRTIKLIPGFFNLTFTTNPGGAFGFLAGNSSPWRHWMFLAAIFVALGMILYFYHQTPRKQPWLGAALAMIAGGAIGNAIDRIRMGEVVDFLDVYLGFTGLPHWPTFNIADSGVSIGVAIFLFHIIFKKVPF